MAEMVGGPLSGLADWATDVIEAAGYAGVGGLIALANVLPPVPVEVLLPLTGFVAGDGRLLFLGVVAAATVGSLVGALLLYGLAVKVVYDVGLEDERIVVTVELGRPSGRS